MKKNYVLLILILLCNMSFARIKEYKQNGEWTDEYLEYRKNQSFSDASSREMGFSFTIDSYKYGLTFYPFNMQTLYDSSNFMEDKTIPKMEITISDENNNKIVWQYETYLRRYFDLENLLFNFPNVIYSNDNHAYNYLGDRWFNSYEFCISVIKRNNKTYLITLLNDSIGAIYECSFTNSTLKLLKEQIIPNCLIHEINLNNKITQEEGVTKIFELIMTSKYKVKMESKILNNIDYQDLVYVDDGGMILNSDVEIISTSFLTESKNIYNIENVKTVEGLPFVPATGQTYSNVITIKTGSSNNRGFIIENGYILKNRPDLYEKNCRVKTLKVIYPNYESPFEQIVTLKDDTSLQYVPFIWNLLDDCKEVQLIIESVYQGSKYNDVCINYIGLVTKVPNKVSEK